MDRKGQRAFRSTTQLALPPEETEIIPDEQIEIDKSQNQEFVRYASLKGHPGWELIKDNFMATVSRYRSGAVLKEAIPNKSLEELGKLTLVTNMVADELEHIVLTVETAAQALEEEKQDGRRKPKEL